MSEPIKMTMTHDGKSVEFTDQDLNKAAKPLATTMIQGIIKRMLNIMGEQDTLAEDLKELKAEAKALGVKSKALTIAIKEHRKPIDQDTKNLANQYFANSGGQYDIFA